MHYHGLQGSVGCKGELVNQVISGEGGGTAKGKIKFYWNTKKIAENLIPSSNFITVIFRTNAECSWL